ncbi:hypothetical protein [Lacticaseibacillus pantheris]|nr:hypothetical protein [Lacticaseibacillus pantheris]
MDDYQLTSALSEAKSVKGGTRAIISARKKLVRKITVRKQTAQAFNHEIELAQQSAKSGNTASALGTINDLLGDKDIQSKPYYQIQIKALELKASLLNGASATTPTNTSSTDDNGAAASSSSASSSDTSSSSSSASASTSAENSSVSGVTSAEISQARADLKSEGVDTSSWSNSDIAKAVLNAKKNGHKKVTESDMENYQK